MHSQICAYIARVSHFQTKSRIKKISQVAWGDWGENGGLYVRWQIVSSSNTRRRTLKNRSSRVR